MKQETNKIKYFKGEFLHPSLDIKNDFIIFGFRFISESVKENEIFVIGTKEEIRIIQNTQFEFEGKSYFIETKGRLLARIEEKWDLEDLNNFTKDYNSAKIGTSNFKELFEKIKELFKKYVELELGKDYVLISGWIIGTYFFPIFSAYPFLHIKAPKQSGKTQLLNFLKQVCFNAVKAKPTLSAFSDTVDSLRGTFLIDQADLFKRKGNEELVDILTDSYKKGGGKRRIRIKKKQNGWETIEQETYSPKAFASVGELPEDLADRCITIPLIKSERNFPEPDEENENWREVRGLFYKNALTNFSIIKSIYEGLKVSYRQNSEIVGRDLELWLPIETILKFCVSDEELKQIRERFAQLYGYTTYEPSELEKATIEAVWSFFQAKENTEIILAPSEIREKIENEEIWEDKMLNDHHKDIRIGKLIKKFNLSTEKKRTNRGMAYLFKKEKVEKIRNRYIKGDKNIAHFSLSGEKWKF